MILGKLLSRNDRGELLVGHEWWFTAALIVAITVFYYGFVDSRDSCTGFFFFELKHDLIGSLYLIPFVYATVILGLVGAATSWVVCLVVLVPRLLQYSLGVDSFLYNMVFLGLPLLVAVTVLLELQWRARHRELMAERECERRMHIERVFKVQEEERQRICQALHDDVLQRLLSIGYVAESLSAAESVANPEARIRVSQIRDESRGLAAHLRRLSYDIRPSILDSLGLVPAANWLINRLQQETGIEARLVTKGRPQRCRAEVETTAFRIVQEALNNVRRHSSASEVVVTVGFVPGHLVVEVSDNGVGFASKQVMRQLVPNGHLGLLGIRQRVASLGGTLTITSRPTNGTRIRAKLPLAADHAVGLQQNTRGAQASIS